MVGFRGSKGVNEGRKKNDIYMHGIKRSMEDTSAVGGVYRGEGRRHDTTLRKPRVRYTLRWKKI